MSSLIQFPFTTRDRIARRYGEEALLNWTEVDQSGVIDEDAIIDAINFITTEMRLYTQQYSNQSLSEHETIIGWATILVACELSASRGNPPPEQLERRCEQIWKNLQAVLDGSLNFKDIAMDEDYRPSSVNRRVDRRYTGNTVRRIKSRTQPGPNKLPQNQSDVYDSEDSIW